MSKLLREPTGRIDTTVTPVAIRRGEGSVEGAAVRYIRGQFPDARPLAMWRSGERHRGNPVYNVEWEDA